MSHDGLGPYMRVEITIGAAIVKRGDKILNNDFVDGTLVFGRALAGEIDEEHVTSEQSVRAIGEFAAGVVQGIRSLLDGGTLAYLGPLEGDNEPMALTKGRVVGPRQVFTGAFLSIPRERNDAEPLQ